MAEALDHSLGLSPRPIAPKEIYTATIHHIIECISDMKNEFTSGDTAGFPITDDCQSLQRLCAKLELLLRSGMKPKTGLLGKKKDYWDYYCDCLSSNKSLNDGIKFVKSLSELKTSLGRGRAFIRFALVHQRLADTIQQCAQNSRTTSEWYLPASVWFQQRLSADLINALYDLNDIQFDLAPRGYDLDTSWPTFARKTFGSPTHSWRPPSRSTSISSLSSIPNIEIYSSSLPLNEEIESAEFQKLKGELKEAEEQCRVMSEQVESVENERIAADGENAELKKTIEQLEKELAEEKKKYDQQEKAMDKLQEELQRKETKWLEREQFLNEKVETSDREMDNLSTTLTSMRQVLGQNMDLTELKGKVTAQQKQILALEMDLRSSKIELDQKINLDSKKSKLIELLDKRLAQSQEEIRQLQLKKGKLCDMVEVMIKDKDAQSKKLIEATAQITELCKVNALMEQEKQSLSKANEQLTKMLGCLETKGREIAKVAKEKVLKYKEESESLQKELDSIKEVMGPGVHQETLAELQADLKAVAAKVSQREEQEAQLSQLQDQLSSTLEKVDDQSQIEELLEVLHSSEKLNLEIKKTMDEMRQERKEQEGAAKKEREVLEIKVAALQKENEELRAAGSSGGAAGEAASAEVGHKEEELTKEKEALTSKVAARDEQIEKLTQELTSLKAAIGQLIGGVNLGGSAPPQPEDGDLFCQLKQLESHFSRLDSTDGAQESLQIELNDLREQLKSKQAEVVSLKETMEGLQEDIEMLKDSHKAMVEDKAKVSEELAAEQAKLLEMEERYREVCKGMEVLKTQYDTACTERTSVVHEKRVLEEKLKAAEEEGGEQEGQKDVEGREGMEGRLRAKEEEYERLESEKNELEREVEGFKAEVNDLKMKLQEAKFMETACQEMSKDKTDLEQQVERVKKELEDAKDLLEKKMNEIEALSEALKTEPKKSEADLKMENVTLREKLLCFLEGKDKMCKQLVVEKEALREQVENLSKTCEEKTMAHEEMVLKVADMEHTLGLLKQEVVTDKNKAEELSKTIEARDKEIRTLKEKMEAASKEKEAEIADLNLDLEGLKEAIQRREKLWDNARESMEMEISALKFQLSSSEMEYETKLRSIEDQHQSVYEQQELDHEQAVEKMGMELNQLQTLQEADIDRHVAEVSDLKSQVQDKTTECSNLQKEKSKLEHKLQEEHNAKLQMQAQLIEQKREFCEQKESFLSDVNCLKDENIDLKKKLIQLIKDKDSLWQKSDRLEYEQKQRAAEIWMDDGDVKRCLSCHTEFSIILRKHHCRMCGKIFCHNCSNNFVMTPRSSRKERVCGSCLMNSSSLQGLPVSSKDSDDISSERSVSMTESFEESIQLPVKKSLKWNQPPAEDEPTPPSSHSISPVGSPPGESTVSVHEGEDPEERSIYDRQTLSLEEETSENEDAAHKADSSEAPQVEGEKSSEEVPTSQGLARGTVSAVTQATLGMTKAMVGMAKAAVNKAATYTPGLPSRGAAAPVLEAADGEPPPSLHLTDDDKAASSGTGHVSSGDSDETFDMITQEEIVTSMMDSLPDPNMISSLLLTADDLTENVEGEPELWIYAGKSYAVPVKLDQSGLTLKWHFTTQPKGINFSVVYKEQDYVPTSACEELVPSCKCNSHKQPVEGELLAHRAGIYTLIFDNTSSRFTAKKLVYKLSIMESNVDDASGE